MTSTPDQATAMDALRAALTAVGHTVATTRTEHGETALTVALTGTTHLRITGYGPGTPRPGWHATVYEAHAYEWLWVTTPLAPDYPADIRRMTAAVTTYAARYRAETEAWRTAHGVLNAGEQLCEILGDAGYRADVLDLGTGLRAIVVSVPGGPAEIWIADANASTEHPASQHTGWQAYYRPVGEYTCGPAEAIYTSCDRNLAADTTRLVHAISQRAAAYAAEHGARG
ncbi:hypothetical protein ACWC9H_27290 [Streptomyces sp. NPDC001251]